MSRATVTLLTDFGTSDAYVSAMKGVVLSVAPEARLVDISHDIAAWDILGGALALADAAPLFPPDTVHLAVVDPGVGGPRQPLLVGSGGHHYIGPDNGLLSLAARTPRSVRRLENEALFRQPVADSFHGRDLFAPVAGHLAAGGEAASLGPLSDSMVELALPEAAVKAGRVHGEVLTVDRFGNLITNIAAALLPGPGERCRVSLAGQAVEGLSSNYLGAEPGRLLALISSRGTVEIALSEGSAAETTGAGRGTAVLVEAI